MNMDGPFWLSRTHYTDYHHHSGNCILLTNTIQLVSYITSLHLTSFIVFFFFYLVFLFYLKKLNIFIYLISVLLFFNKILTSYLSRIKLGIFLLNKNNILSTFVVPHQVDGFIFFFYFYFHLWFKNRNGICNPCICLSLYLLVSIQLFLFFSKIIFFLSKRNKFRFVSKNLLYL